MTTNSPAPTDAAAPTVKIDIWSDVACPWCYVGKRRLETALGRLAESGDGPQVDIEYHSFELAPDTPVDFDGTEVDFLAGHKGMPRAQVEQMLGQMTQLAAAEGLRYDFDALQHTKTLTAHELLHHAKAHGKQVEMKERLLKAYFEEGRHVGRVEELADLAAEVGLDARRSSRRSRTGAGPTTSRPTSTRRAPTGSTACRSSWSTGGTASRVRRTRRCSSRCCSRRSRSVTRPEPRRPGPHRDAAWKRRISHPVRWNCDSVSPRLDAARTDAGPHVHRRP